MRGATRRRVGVVQVVPQPIERAGHRDGDLGRGRGVMCRRRGRGVPAGGCRSRASSRKAGNWRMPHRLAAATGLWWRLHGPAAHRRVRLVLTQRKLARRQWRCQAPASCALKCGRPVCARPGWRDGGREGNGSPGHDLRADGVRACALRAAELHRPAVAGHQAVTLRAGTWHHGLIAPDGGDFAVIERRGVELDNELATVGVAHGAQARAAAAGRHAASACTADRRRCRPTSGARSSAGPARAQVCERLRHHRDRQLGRRAVRRRRRARGRPRRRRLGAVVRMLRDGAMPAPLGSATRSARPARAATSGSTRRR